MAKRKSSDKLPPTRRGADCLLDALLGLGVGFKVKDGQLIALGDGVSPVVQAMVTDRQSELMRMLPECGVAPRQRKRRRRDAIC